MADRPFKRWLKQADLRSPKLPMSMHNSGQELADSSTIRKPADDNSASLALTHRENAVSFLQKYNMRLGWALQDAHDHLLILLARERDMGSPFNFAPVALGLGIATYFSTSAEPVTVIVFMSFLVATGIAFSIQSRGATYIVAASVALFLLGMSVAQIRTNMASGPVIARQITGEIGGIVVGRDFNSRGNPRYLIRPQRIEGLADRELPRLIRLSAASRHVSYEPGQAISGIARLQGFSGPAHKNGFDFSFSNWFDGLGGTGFFMGKPGTREVGVITNVSLADKITITINSVRLAIAERVRQNLPNENGTIAVALIIGDRSGIPAATQESLRQSGLAHILAISSLHMALVTLTVLWSLRSLFSLSPAITLNYPTRKWAAVGGLAAATIYLFLSGGAVATFRSWIMLSIMLSAILMDRKAMTIRNVVLAALVVLMISPESLLEPGFQMSFAAAGALVAAYSQFTQWRSQKARKQDRKTGFWTAPGLLAGYVFGLMFTSLIAGLATGIFSAWHFHRIAPLGLVSNLLAMPIVSMLVMPLALTSALLMPYGLESLTLAPLKLAINLVVSVSGWVNTIPVPAITGVQSIAVLLCGAAGLLILILLKTKLRLIGILPIVAMFLVADNQLPPDIVISQDGRAIGIRDASGKLAIPYPRRNRFITDIWLRAWSEDVAGNREAIVAECNEDHCIAVTPQGIRVEIVFAPSLISSACNTADILVAPPGSGGRIATRHLAGPTNPKGKYPFQRSY